MNTAVCEAIKKRAEVEFFYDGPRRMVKPHCHGISPKGKEMVRGYQTGGYSESGHPVAWKLFDVSKILNWKETGKTFAENRPGYDPNDKELKQVHCCV